MTPLPRVVRAEILDTLPPADPRAHRSRRDLRLVDAFMGNSRWITDRILGAHGGTRIVELGAGEGRLCSRLRALRPNLPLTGLDLVERPVGLDSGIEWIQGDFFQTLTRIRGGICIGSLILHHFQDPELARLGRLLSVFDRLCFCEPLRSRQPLAMSMLAWPFAGEVTRHDMPASIRAGFLPGELPRLLDLDPRCWTIRESANWRGVLRFEAVRHP